MRRRWSRFSSPQDPRCQAGPAAGVDDATAAACPPLQQSQSTWPMSTQTAPGRNKPGTSRAGEKYNLFTSRNTLKMPPHPTAAEGRTRQGGAGILPEAATAGRVGVSPCPAGARPPPHPQGLPNTGRSVVALGTLHPASVLVPGAAGSSPPRRRRAQPQSDITTQQGLVLCTNTRVTLSTPLPAPTGGSSPQAAPGGTTPSWPCPLNVPPALG